jgi:hypothetical protein
MAPKKQPVKKAPPAETEKPPKKVVPPPVQKKRKGTDDPGYNFASKFTPIENQEFAVAATLIHPRPDTEDPGYSLAFNDLTPPHGGTEDPGYNEVPRARLENIVSQVREVLREASCTTEDDADEGTEDPGYDED